MLSHFFIDRPIFATVLSIVIVVVGGIALIGLPIAQYPDVAPPTVQVTATYPGANAVTVAETVATPIELEINGVERMLYMSSKSTNDGQMMLDITFELGTDLDTAQVLVQNRVAVAEAKLPEEVKRLGVTTKKKSPSILLCVNLISPGNQYDQLYLSNFAALNVKDEIARIEGVGDVSYLGPRDYSMRVWLDPNKLASRQMTAAEVMKAIQEQNVQVAAGRLGAPPVAPGSNFGFQVPINTQGRLSTTAEFEKIVVRSGERGQLVYLRDVVRDSTYGAAGEQLTAGIELGAKNYDVNAYLDGQPSITLAAFQLPGSNALETSHAIRAKMEELKTGFPEGIDYRIEYDTTVFVEESIKSVYHTLIEAIALVFIVVLVFLQNWRATVIPMIAVPVSLIGTFAVMSLLGFSLNNLSLFGLVLAIGIVVDDAIVVVENVERLMLLGLSPRDATRKAMEEVTGPVIAIGLVLCAVFVPTAFMAGISGQFYRQFALTIAASTIISAFNSLTLSPALCALLLKPHAHGEHAQRPDALPRLGLVVIGALLSFLFLAGPVAQAMGYDVAAHGAAAHHPPPGWLMPAVLVVGGILGWILAPLVNRALAGFFVLFNKLFDVSTAVYGGLVKNLLQFSLVVLLIYGGLMALTGVAIFRVPVGFIPEQDKGYLIVNVQLPDGASLERSDVLIRKLSEVVGQTEGVAHSLDLSGYSILLGTNLSNAAGMFVILDPFEERAGHPELGAPAIAKKLRAEFSKFQEAQVSVFGAPPVEGLGSTGGFKMQVQDRRNAGLRALQGGVQNLAEQGMSQYPGQFAGLFSSFSVSQPQIFLKIDREKAKAEGVSLDDIHLTLQTFLGGSYVNDFSFQNRSWQVNVQSDPAFRMTADDIGRLEVRNAAGGRVPFATLMTIKDVTGPAIVNRYQLYPSAELTGVALPGVSSGVAVPLMENLAREQLPNTLGFQWTELTLQQILASKDLLTKLVFPLAVVFVFLVLAAQYESWTLPVSIILIVPMCILAALLGVVIAKLDNNVFVQIGLVVLVGLAAKNAILIVEFAKQLQDEGQPLFEATVKACKLRLRPILMTSLAFILGVVPLVLAKGAGAEMRATLGITVFSGMLGVTIFGVLFTPVFFFVIRRFSGEKSSPPVPTSSSADH
ncbi:efflux RND transporter permease subunit [Planctomicrobium piriforme]|uniref:Multidrug efflux pump n=1 Tax=Planctomicrobium piriforme TaxID=1576369 RepID=A0A1I3R9H5_9PLAN|nr:efflux RND transporter permease subunit [Planctomicrobium piriforme]SFJ42700.1 multidrug efflux pump [Planctomicrobium piriforme]